MLVPVLVAADVTSTSPLAPATYTCLTLNTPVAQGTYSNDVAALQTFLDAKGYLTVSPTGYFGGLTFAAVEKFQSDNNVPPTGYVGPLTMAALKSVSCGVATAALPIKITSPQAQSILLRGTPEVFSWMSVASTTATSTLAPVVPNQSLYDIVLVPSRAPCVATNTACPNFVMAPYPIDGNISSHGNYGINYSWTVGSTTGTRVIPAGQYSLEVCVANTVMCATSDTFSLVDSTSTQQ